MPTYVYEALCAEKSCDYCANAFELVQRIQEPTLTNCPKCGGSVHRVIQPVGIRMGNSHMLSDNYLKTHGFTKLVKEGDKKYRKI